MRNRTDFAGSSVRRVKRSNASRSVPHAGAIDLSIEPKRPPVLVLYEELVPLGPEGMPMAIYGQYPAGLIAKLLPWLQCERREILHVCSGALPPGEGIRVDIRPAAKPDVLASGAALPFADGSIAAVLIDPPYTEEYAKSLYGVKYVRPSTFLREATRVVRPGGRIAIVHYITPKPVAGMKFVKAFGLSTGFDMPMRAVTIFQRDMPELAL